MNSSASEATLGWSTKLLYSSGAAMSAMSGRAIAAFLMIYYSQVLSLSPALVAGAISLTLLFDAVCDPLVGQISDNFRSRWGRRHPFMYFAALPVAISFYCLWNPPAGWSDDALLAWMVVWLLSIRAFDTFFELPSAALLPELTKDYSQRSTLFALRSIFSIGGGVVMSILAYRVFMKERPDGTGGVLAPDGYGSFGLTFAIVLAVIILVSSLGTHRCIRNLAQPASRRMTGTVARKEVFETLRNSSFWILAATGTLVYAAGGLRFAMEVYFGLYYWELAQAQLALMSLGIVSGVLLGAPLVPFMTRRIGKKKTYFVMATGSILLGSLPFVLRLAGLAPDNGTQGLFWLLFLDGAVYNIFFIGTGVTLSSMMSDLVEDSEVKTGRRSEGLLLAADNLIRKSVSGIGPLLTGLILTVVAFPLGAERGTVPAGTLEALVLIYVPLMVVMLFGAACIVSFFRIDEARHNENLRILRERADRAESPVVTEPHGGSDDRIEA